MGNSATLQNLACGWICCFNSDCKLVSLHMPKCTSIKRSTFTLNVYQTSFHTFIYAWAHASYLKKMTGIWRILLKPFPFIKRPSFDGSCCQVDFISAMLGYYWPSINIPVRITRCPWVLQNKRCAPSVDQRNAMLPAGEAASRAERRERSFRRECEPAQAH